MEAEHPEERHVLVDTAFVVEAALEGAADVDGEEPASGSLLNPPSNSLLRIRALADLGERAVGAEQVFNRVPEGKRRRAR